MHFYNNDNINQHKFTYRNELEKCSDLEDLDIHLWEED